MFGDLRRRAWQAHNRWRVGAKRFGALGGRQRLPAAQRRWERAEGRVRVGPLQLTPGDLWRTVRPQLARIAREKVRR